MNTRYRKHMRLRSRRHRKGPVARPLRPLKPIQWGACAWAPEPCHTAIAHTAVVRQIVRAATSPAGRRDVDDVDVTDGVL